MKKLPGVFFIILGLGYDLWAIEFDDSLGEYKEILEDDIKNICNFNWSHSFPKKTDIQQNLEKGFGIDSFDCASLNSWLEERIQFLTMETKGKIVKCSDKAVRNNEFTSFFQQVPDIAAANLSGEANYQFGEEPSKTHCFKFLGDEFIAYVPFFPLSYKEMVNY